MTATKTMKVSGVHDDIDTAVSEIDAAIRQEALTKWRAWVDEAVETGKGPKSREFLDVGTSLGFKKPGDQLKADVAAKLAWKRAGEKRIESFAKEAEILAPFGGTIQGVRDAILAAEREVKRLANVLRRADNSSSGFWESQFEQKTRKNHPHLEWAPLPRKPKSKPKSK